ncbi:MAG: TetR/AcrR family transcriptional regulator [Streptosporangiaceae bacterium]
MTLGQSVTSPPQRRAAVRAPGRQQAKRERIVQVAMDHFAASGYEGAKVEAIAAAAGVSKGAVFGYFGSKAGLFLATYQAATRSFSRYLDAPDEVLADGFFAVVTYWLRNTPELIHRGWVPYRVTLLGNYCSDLGLRRSITQYLEFEDPYGTRAFVQFGIARGEVRTDIDAAMIVSLTDWLMDRLQDEIVTEELDPGLFGRATQPRQLREGQFIELLRSAVGATSSAGPGKEPASG